MIDDGERNSRALPLLRRGLHAAPRTSFFYAAQLASRRGRTVATSTCAGARTSITRRPLRRERRDARRIVGKFVAMPARRRADVARGREAACDMGFSRSPTCSLSLSLSRRDRGLQRRRGGRQEPLRPCSVARARARLKETAQLQGSRRRRRRARLRRPALQREDLPPGRQGARTRSPAAARRGARSSTARRSRSRRTASSRARAPATRRDVNCSRRRTGTTTTVMLKRTGEFFREPGPLGARVARPLQEEGGHQAREREGLRLRRRARAARSAASARCPVRGVRAPRACAAPRARGRSGARARRGRGAGAHDGVSGGASGESAKARALPALARVDARARPASRAARRMRGALKESARSARAIGDRRGRRGRVGARDDARRRDGREALAAREPPHSARRGGGAGGAAAGAARARSAGRSFAWCEPAPT